ncbi:MAG: hypothetical protein ACO25F_03645 [Erythrobacter sp.]
MEPQFGSRPSGPSLKGILLAATASFLLGAAAVGYYVWSNSDGEMAAGLLTGADKGGAAPSKTGRNVVPEARPTDIAVAEQAVELVAEQQGGLDQRLAAAEQRIARLDLQAQAAAGNAARAEGLLIAFATRRAVERGAELGYLEAQLRLRFGDSWPNAVRTIITFSRDYSRDPLTLDVLLARFEGLAPELSADRGIESWADVRRELSELFIVRRESTPSPQPARRLERARQFLETGRVDAAISEIENLPGAAKADAWIADARRYAAAMEALETIETAAVLDPGRLRDGAGNPVEQRSPVDSPGN